MPKLDRIKRLDCSISKIEGKLTDEEYASSAECIRNDVDTLIKYAKTPEEKLKYTRYIFKLGQMYLWKPWKVGTLTAAKSREYVLGRAMQAEQKQYKYLDVVKMRSRALETRPSALRVRIPARELNGDAHRRCIIAERKVQKYLKLVKIKFFKLLKIRNMYRNKNIRAYEHWENTYEQWVNTHNALDKAKLELESAKADSTLLQ